MPFEAIWPELKKLYETSADDGEPRLTKTHIQKWVGATGASKALVYDEIAKYLARGFNDNQLEFEFCDAVLNDIQEVIAFADEEPPALFWKIFLAFDAGVFNDTGKKGNPVDVLTRPQIAAIVKGLK